jgi:hypothetical protein
MDSWCESRQFFFIVYTNSKWRINETRLLGWQKFVQKKICTQLKPLGIDVHVNMYVLLCKFSVPIENYRYV